MKKLKLLLKPIIVSVVLLTTHNAHAVEAPVYKSLDKSLSTGKYIVVFKDDEQLSQDNVFSTQEFDISATALTQNMEKQYAIQAENVYESAIKGFYAKLTEAQIQALRNNSNVKYIEEEIIFSINRSSISNSKQYNPPSWGLDRIDQRDRRLDRVYNYQFDGSGVNAYVLDTGIRISHNEFEGRAQYAYNFIDNNNNADDCHGHGTHVAGTIGGKDYGVAKNVTLHALKVLGCNGSGGTNGIVDALEWIAENGERPGVVNMSLGAFGSINSINEAIDSIVDEGFTVVVSAGNDYGADACRYTPAQSSSAITVGATTASDRRSYFSNVGRCLDIFAPGSRIRSAGHTSDTAIRSQNGTSMAAPHVAGVAAMYLQEKPSSTPEEIKNTITSKATKNIIRDTRSGSPNLLLFSLKSDEVSNDICQDTSSVYAVEGNTPWGRSTYLTDSKSDALRVDRSASWWRYQGEVFKLEKKKMPNTLKMYRFWRSSSFNHFSTASRSEINYVLSDGWVRNGDLGYIYPLKVDNKLKPLYRVHKKWRWNSARRAYDIEHRYTTSRYTLSYWVRWLGFKDDGIVGYVCK